MQREQLLHPSSIIQLISCLRILLLKMFRVFQKVNLAKNKLQVNLSVEEIKPFPYLATFFSEDKESVNRRACFNFIQVVQSMNYGKKIRTIMRQPVENCARFT